VLQGLPLKVLSLADFAFVSEVIEDRPDLYGNAIKKATEVADQVKTWTLADDTGLEVDALNGAPGVFAARYSGPGATYESNCRQLLYELRDIPDGKRTAQFRTVMALRTHDGLYCVEGVVAGTIRREFRGTSGFGYDPVFALRNGKTLAELTLSEKNAVSHRGNALRRMVELLNWLTRGT
jgi:XTP/dITP diphosphohydrolase